ncbi:MAG: PEGA domain-containing protein [Nitrospirae bacterium]|nr:PEGA domain-containing protein [Nitrospirota bacterium]
MRRLHRLAIGVAALGLAGCATTYPVLFKSDPPEAQVYLNDIPIGKTPVAWDFPAIEHNEATLRVEKEGYKPMEREIRAESLSAHPWRTFSYSLLGGVGVVFAPTFEEEYSADLIPTDSTEEYPSPSNERRTSVRRHVVGLQYGEHVPPKSAYFHRNEAYFKPGQLNAFLLQLSYHVLYAPRLALGFDLGTSEGDQEFRNNNDSLGRLEIFRTVLFASHRFYLLRGDHDLYPYVGAGLFGLLKTVSFQNLLPESQEVAEPDVDRDVFGFGGGLGYAYAVTPMVHVTVDARYTYALAKNVNALGDNLDLGGFQFVVGPEWRF